MAKYKTLNWAKVFAPLSKKLLTIPVVNIKYSRQLGKQSVVVLEVIVLV
jgi:hypothetical protein